MDLSTESQVRQQLRQRLTNLAGQREELLRGKGYARPPTIGRRRPAVLVAALILGVLLISALIWPDAFNAIAQEVIKTLKLGKNTTVILVDPEQTAPPAVQTEVAGWTPTVEGNLRIVLEDDHWSICTAISCSGGNIPPGYEATIRRYNTVAEAQTDFVFTLKQPAYLPAGYTLREVMLSPTRDYVYFYDGPESEIVLFAFGGGSTTGTSGSLDEVEVNGQPAAWVNGNMLVWDADGCSFSLEGLDLTLDQAIRIAESLHWVER
jgi:hypothetical protein